jgi:tetratricopeptide (TPR) repeat protein
LSLTLPLVIVIYMNNSVVMKRGLHLLLIAILGLVLFSCVTKPEVEVFEDEPYSAISLQVIAGDYEAAIAAYEKSRAESPDSLETQTLYGGLLMIAGDVEAAKEVLQQALELDEANTNALYYLSLIEGFEGNEAAQIDLLEGILEIEPESVEANSSLGEIYLVNNDLENAEKYFEAALGSEEAGEGGNLVANMGYAKVLAKTDRKEEALKQYNEAVEIAPDYSFARIDRGKLLSSMSDYDAAEADFTAAIELEPDYYWHYIDRGKLRLLGKSDLDGALEDFSKAIEIRPDHFYAYIYRGGIMEDKKDYKQAYEDYSFVISERPDYYYAYEALGTLAFIQEEYVESHEYFKKAISYDRDRPDLILMSLLAMYPEYSIGERKDYFNSVLRQLDRQSLYYHVARSLVEPGYEQIAFRNIEGEKDRVFKYQMLFYLAVVYYWEDRQSLAFPYFDAMQTELMPGMSEKRISEWLLSKF